MENLDQDSIFELVIDHESQNHLIEIAKWAKLLSIMGIIAGLLVSLGGLVTALLGSSMNSIAGMRGMAPILGIILLFFGLIYLYPSWLLLKYSTAMPAAIKKNDQLLVNESFKNLKSCFRFWGILALVILGFYALLFIVQLFSSVL